jgi:hypothetical protein
MSRHLPAISGKQLLRALSARRFCSAAAKGQPCLDGKTQRRELLAHDCADAPRNSSRPLSDILNQIGLTKDDLAKLL